MLLAEGLLITKQAGQDQISTSGTLLAYRGMAQMRPLVPEWI
jgi:hypothetical protein